MKSILVLIVITVFASAVHAQVQCSLSATAPSVIRSSGDRLTGKVSIEILPGWHISSLTQPDGGPLATEITLRPGQPFRLAGKIIGEKPKIQRSEAFDMDVEYYTGTVTFTLPLIVTNDIKPDTKLTVEITYQACNDETCLLPKTEVVSCIIGVPEPTGEQGKPAEKKP